MVVGALVVAAVVLAGTVGLIRLATAERDAGPPPFEVERSIGPEPARPAPTPTVPGTAAPHATGPGAGRGDLTVTVRDSTGRFTVSVPRTWLQDAASNPTAVLWRLTTVDAQGQVHDARIVFGIEWQPSGGCTLKGCADRVIADQQASTPHLPVSRQASQVSGLPAERLDVVSDDEHLTVWVVVKGDRAWLARLLAPKPFYDQGESVVLDVIDTLTLD